MSVAVTLASAADDAAMRRLVRSQAMPGRVRLSFCREPDFSIGCAVTGEDYRILVARPADGEDVVGVACRSVRRVFLNGREQRIGYLGQLRVDERYRGRWLVSRGFARLEQMQRADPLPAYLVSIVDGNDEATAVLVQKARRGFPEFLEVARYVTLALRVRRSRFLAGLWASATDTAGLEASATALRWGRPLGRPSLAEIASQERARGASCRQYGRPMRCAAWARSACDSKTFASPGEMARSRG
jgi:hypothetical protein